MERFCFPPTALAFGLDLDPRLEPIAILTGSKACFPEYNVARIRYCRTLQPSWNSQRAVTRSRRPRIKFLMPCCSSYLTSIRKKLGQCEYLVSKSTTLRKCSVFSCICTSEQRRRSLDEAVLITIQSRLLALNSIVSHQYSAGRTCN